VKFLKKLGFPLLFASIIGFKLAASHGGMALYYVSGGLMIAGGLLIVASVFIRPDEEGPVPGLPPAPAAESGLSFPLSAGIDVPNPVPNTVYIAGGLASAAGALVFFTGPDGVNRTSVISFALIPGGILYILGATFFYGDPADRRNILRGAAALISFLMIFGGIMTFVFIAAGAFDQGRGRPYAVLAVFSILLGMWGAYYGMKYQQSAEGRAIGRKLGFTDADGAVSSDGAYDSKGVMNGVETLFNVEPQSGGRNSPPFFTLEVLCRCSNTRGVALSVRPEGFLGKLAISFNSLPRLPGVPYWDFYEVRCDRPDFAQDILAEARHGDNIFNDKAGFLEMSLEGSDFKFAFRSEGYADTAYVYRVLQETSKLASLFH
jgi:hypothetical protein